MVQTTPRIISWFFTGMRDIVHAICLGRIDTSAHKMTSPAMGNHLVEASLLRNQRTGINTGGVPVFRRPTGSLSSQTVTKAMDGGSHLHDHHLSFANQYGLPPRRTCRGQYHRFGVQNGCPFVSRPPLRYLPQQSGHPPLAGKYQGLPDFPACDELQPYNGHRSACATCCTYSRPCANSEYGTEYHLYPPQSAIVTTKRINLANKCELPIPPMLDYSSSALKFQYYASTIRFVVPYAQQPMPLPYQRDRHQSR